MINLYDQGNGALIGSISEQQLQFMIEQMEEESLEDRDYSITPLTLGYFVEQDGDPALVNLLQQALGTRAEMIIRWSRAS